MKKRSFFILAFAGVVFSAFAQSTERPKLVVGIVVDQMRADYLLRFQENFTEKGFKKLMNEGFNCKNVHYNYQPTSTAPGHASIFTGTTPSVHGIVGNYWYSTNEKEGVYCVKLKTEEGSIESPERLLSESFADGMKQFSGFRSKSYGVSLKDRGAILPAGHSANGAYWFSSSKGKWVSSDYYKEQETEWLTKFNSQNLEEEYLENGWSLSLPKKEYNKSASDENNYELSLSDRSGSVFPYDLKSVRKEIGWGVLKRVPQGNQMTADLAKLIIKEEELGKGEVSDFISISFSATDYVGHRFGVQSVEVQDTYIKLDSTLADLLQFLDEQVGSKNYLLFLTADHGASYPRNYLKEKKLPAGEINAEKMLEELQKEVNELSGRKGWLITSTNLNFYFNRELKSKYPEEYEKVKRFSKLWLQEYKGVAEVLDTENSICAEKGILKKAIMGVHPQRSGELIVIPKPNWNTYFDKGSTHGSAYTYDTHVPLLFYGAGVENGSTATHYPITSIVPTLSQISGIPFQSSGEATVINELVKQ